MKESKVEQSEPLPIYELDEEIVRAVQGNRRLILQAPQVRENRPRSHKFSWMAAPSEIGRCVILQPRRLATRMLAKRVAEERGCELGTEVGYQIRLDNVSSAETRILFVTEGILLRQMLVNPRLEGISTLIFDEFHERHLFSDVALPAPWSYRSPPARTSRSSSCPPRWRAPNLNAI